MIDKGDDMPVLDPQALKDDREALAFLDAVLGVRRAAAPLPWLSPLTIRSLRDEKEKSLVLN